jgi:hypothetical protein
MSTISGENKAFHQLFKDRLKCTGHPENRGAFPVKKPYLRLIRFQGH